MIADYTTESEARTELEIVDIFTYIKSSHSPSTPRSYVRFAALLARQHSSLQPEKEPSALALRHKIPLHTQQRTMPSLAFYIPRSFARPLLRRRVLNSSISSASSRTGSTLSPSPAGRGAECGRSESRTPRQAPVLTAVPSNPKWVGAPFSSRRGFSSSTSFAAAKDSDELSSASPPSYTSSGGSAGPSMHVVAGGESEWSQDANVQRARRRIFGTHRGDGLRSGRKYLRRGDARAKAVAQAPGAADNWRHDWFKSPEGMFGLPKNFPDLVIKADTKARKKALGKGPPKKGAGKRATKK